MFRPHPSLARVYFGINLSDAIKRHYNEKSDKHLEQARSLQRFVDDVQQQPEALRNPHQRIWTRITQGGVTEVPHMGEAIRSFDFLRQPFGDDEDGLEGLEEPFNEIADALEQAAKGTEKAKSMILLVGGPGSGKSTTINKLMAAYQEELIPAVKWVDLPEPIARQAHAGEEQVSSEFEDPVVYNPLLLLPKGVRKELQDSINAALKARDPDSPFPYKLTKGGVPPASVEIIDALKRYYKEKHPELSASEIYEKVLTNHARVHLVSPDPVRRKAIGIQEAEPPKYANPAHMHGEPHLKKSAILGTSNALAFDYLLGAANASSGGMLHLREGLKREPEDLLKLLMINEEGKVKAAEIGDISVQNIVWMDANFPEYFEKRNNEALDAFFERTRIIYFTYPTDYKKESRIYKNYFDRFAKWDGLDVAPHTYDITALWAVMTRLKLRDVAINEAPESLQEYDFLLKKAKLYSGEPVDGISLEQARQWKKEDKEQFEGLVGVSPRIMKRNVLSDILTHPQVKKAKAVDGFLVLDAIEDWLKFKNREVRISDEVDKPKYLYLVQVAREELKKKVITDVDDVLLPEQEFNREISTYLDNVRVYGNAVRKLERAQMANNQGVSVPLGTFRKTIDDVNRLLQPLELGGRLTEPEEAHHYRMALYERMLAAEKAGMTFELDSRNKLRDGLLAMRRRDVLEAYPLIPVDAVRLDDVPSEGARKVLAPVVDTLKRKGYPEPSALKALRVYGALGNR